jgi:hypothetical protein
MTTTIRRSFLLTVICLSAWSQPAQQQGSPKRLFIDEKKKSYSLELTRQVQKRCGSAITVTENQNTADYKLTLSVPTSALYNEKGDVVHVFRTPFLIKNIAKEVCDFVGSQH